MPLDTSFVEPSVFPYSTEVLIWKPSKLVYKLDAIYSLFWKHLLISEKILRHYMISKLWIFNHHIRPTSFYFWLRCWYITIKIILKRDRTFNKQSMKDHLFWKLFDIFFSIHKSYELCASRKTWILQILFNNFGLLIYQNIVVVID